MLYPAPLKVCTTIVQLKEELTDIQPIAEEQIALVERTLQKIYTDIGLTLLMPTYRSSDQQSEVLD